MSNRARSFAGKTNGELISIAEESGFEVLLTVDKGLAHEPNMAGRKIAIIIVRAKSNRLADLLPHASACIAHISSVRHGQIVRIGECPDKVKRNVREVK